MASALAALVLAVGLTQHELWRDESQAWLLARAAPSFWSLLTGQARQYEGHPFLWFWVLRAVSLVSTSWVALQVTAFAVALGNACLLLRLPGLPRFARVLLAAGYFPLFEFGVLARNYGLALCCLLLALHASRLKSRARPLWVALAAGLAVNTVLLALPAAALVVGVTSAPALLRARRRRGKGGKHRLDAWSALAGLSVFATAVSFARATTPVPTDAVAQLGPLPAVGDGLLRLLGERLFTAFAPIPALDSGLYWWNTNLLFHGPIDATTVPGALTPLPALLGGAWLAAWVWVLRRERLLAAGLGLSILVVLLIIVRLPYRALRYDGHIMLCVVVALALAAARRPGLFRRRSLRALTAVTLGASALAGGSALLHDAVYPFSQSKNAARTLTRLGLARAPLVGVEYYRMSPLAAYLGRQPYSPELGRNIAYGVWSTRWHHPGYSTLRRSVVRRGLCHALHEARPGRPAYLITSFALLLDPLLRSELPRVANLPPSTNETYEVYRVEQRGGAPSHLAMLCAEQR